MITVLSFNFRDPVTEGRIILSDKLEVVLLQPHNKEYQCHDRQNSPADISSCNFPIRRLCMVDIADPKCQTPTEQLICKQNRNCIENADKHSPKPCKPFALMCQLGSVHQFQYSSCRWLHGINYVPVFIPLDPITGYIRKSKVI